MAEVKNPKALFKVELTEYERGWGQKPWEDKFFDNETEARKWADDYNNEHNNKSEVPDWYVMARYVGRVV